MRAGKRAFTPRKDESIDTNIIDKYSIALGPFIFTLYFNKDQFLNKISDQTQLRHNHRNFELQYFVDGNGTFEVGNSMFDIQADSICLIGPKIYHVPHKDNDKPVLKYTFQFDYKLNDRNRDSGKDGNQDKNKDRDKDRNRDSRMTPWCMEIHKALSGMTLRNLKGNREILSLFERIKNELEHHSAFFEYNLYNIFSEIMIGLLRSLVDEKKIQPDKKTTEDMRDLKIEIYFDENYWRPDLTAEDMAGSIGISTRHLNRLIGKNFNTTFKQKLIQTRIESAKGFLAGTDSTIAGISENVGFNSTEYFYRSFKQETGVTPGDYRRQNQKSH